MPPQCLILAAYPLHIRKESFCSRPGRKPTNILSKVTLRKPRCFWIPHQATIRLVFTTEMITIDSYEQSASDSEHGVKQTHG